MRHRQWIVWSVVVVGALMLAGCGAKKDAQQAGMTSSDSLVSANPTESGQGTLTPQGQAPAPEPQAAAPETRAPEPRREAPARHETRRSEHRAAAAPAEAPGTMVPAGTGLVVIMDSKISTETAQSGDSWTGKVKSNVIVDGKVVIPEGAAVHGTLTEVKPAAKGDRATLGLAVTSIDVGGGSVSVHASTEPIVAGSTRARNIGAVAGGTAAGALIGGAVGGGKGALIGGLLGAAATGTGVAKSKGYQVELKAGTEVDFSTTDAVKIRS